MASVEPGDSLEHRLKDPGYKNRLKAGMCFIRVKEGLETFVDAESNLLHKDILTRCKPCGKCTNNKKLCSKCVSFKREIENIHKCKRIWGNTDVQKWLLDHWSVAKCLMNPGQSRNNTASETDISGLLNFIIHYNNFQDPKYGLIQENAKNVREDRNNLVHCGHDQLSDADLKSYTNNMLKLLMDENPDGQLKGNKEAENAKIQIQEVLKKNFVILLEDEYKVKLTDLEGRVDDLDSEFQKLKQSDVIQGQKIGKTAEEVRDLEQKYEQIRAKIDKIQEDHHEVQTLKAGLQVQETIIKNLSGRVECKFSIITQQFNEIHTHIEELKSKVAHLEAVTRDHGEKLEVLYAKVPKEDEISDKVGRNARKRRLTDDQEGPASKRIPSYQQEIGHLREDLKSFYKTLSSIPISPFDEEETLPLQDLYMEVMIEHQTEGKNTMNGNFKDRNSEMLSSYKDLFFDKRHQRIVLTGLSGSGKSVFCRNIVHIWSTEEPNKQNEYAQEKDLSIPDKQRVIAEKKETGHTCIVEELDMFEAIAHQDILLQFTLLFYICAPKIDSEKTLTEVLHKQCIQIESDHLSKFFKEQPEKVLIIIDGIDEMKGEMPSFLDDLLKRKLHPRIIVLMVMRPWKISQLKLKPSSHYDLLLEVQGMSEKNALKFVQKMIDICKKYITVEMLDPSPEEQKVMSSFKKTPLLLMFLARIWCQDQSLPKRQQDLYRKIIECVIERFLNKTGSKYIPASTAQDTISIKKKAFWEMHVESACQVAHHFLLQGVSGSSVVMSEMDLMKQFEANGSNEAAQLKLNALLGCGILSKLDAFSPLGEKNVFVAFLHLSVQEYLTSIHLVRNENAFQNFLISLKTLNDVLKYENLFIFICGLDAERGHTAFKRVCEVCDDDPHVRQYRQGRDILQEISSIYNLNEMYRACLNEMDNQSLVKMTDICVDNIEWYNNLVPKLEPSFVKSLELKFIHDKGNVVIYYNYIHLEHLDLCNITLNDVIDLSSLTKLTYLILFKVTMSVECSRSLCSSIKSCIYLECLDLGLIKLLDGVIDLSSLTKLTNLILFGVTMTMECSRSLCSSIKSCIHLECLYLEDIILLDGVIDLSSLSNLTSLRLNDVTMTVECSRSLCSSIKSCIHLGRLDLRYITLNDGVIDLSSLTKLTFLILNKAIMSVECSRSLCSSIKSCIHLERLHLLSITLHDGVIDLSSLTKLTSLTLNDVTMTVECSRSLCSSIKSCIHLKSLDLEDIILHDGVIDLSSLSNLSFLNFSNVKMSPHCRQTLLTSQKRCQKLTFCKM